MVSTKLRNKRVKFITAADKFFFWNSSLSGYLYFF